MPRGGSAKGAPRGNAKKRVVELEDGEQPNQLCGNIKTPPKPADETDFGLDDLGKSPLED